MERERHLVISHDTRRGRIDRETWRTSFSRSRPLLSVLGEILSSIFLPWLASFSHFPPPSPDGWMTPCFLSHSPPSPPPFCPHLWLLPSAVLPCLPCFTLHPQWAACSSCIMYECPFVSRGAGAIVKQSKFRWLILKAEKRRAKKIGFDLLLPSRTSNKCFVVCVFIGAERDGFIILRF